VSQPTETPAPILALYEAASATRELAGFHSRSEVVEALYQLADELQGRADKATLMLHAREVKEAKR
jgi:hypothetical protein